MKNVRLLSLILVGFLGFVLIGCEMGNTNALPDIRGDWRQTNMGGKNAVADLQITSTKVFVAAAKGHGEWKDQGTYTYDMDHITVNLNNYGSSTYSYWMYELDGKDVFEIFYRSGDGRQLVVGQYFKESSIDW